MLRNHTKHVLFRIAVSCYVCDMVQHVCQVGVYGRFWGRWVEDGLLPSMRHTIDNDPAAYHDREDIHLDQHIACTFGRRYRVWH